MNQYYFGYFMQIYANFCENECPEECHTKQFSMKLGELRVKKEPLQEPLILFINNNNKNVTYKALTTEVSKRYTHKID